LEPILLAWYGEHPQENQSSTIFLLGRGFNVFETQVIAGGVDIPDAQKRLISRNVMEIVIPANARVYKHECPKESGQVEKTGQTPPHPTPASGYDPNLPLNPNPNRLLTMPLNPDPTLPLNPDPSKAKQKKPCGWAVIDVHVATPNGISNHLYVETDPKQAPADTKNIVMTATTVTTTDPRQNTTTTSTRVETTPPGMALPPLTVLPLGTQWPAHSVFAQGTYTGAPAGSVFPGMVNTPTPAPALSAPVLNPAAPVSGSVPSTAAPVPPPSPSVSPEAVPPAAPVAPAAPAVPSHAGQPVPGSTSFSPSAPVPRQFPGGVSELLPPTERRETQLQATAMTRTPAELPLGLTLTQTGFPGAALPNEYKPAEARRPPVSAPTISFRTATPKPPRGPESRVNSAARTIIPPPRKVETPANKAPAKQSFLGRLGLGDH
jgi:hypothetical protein